MAKPVRRIVTGHRADGRSVILSDDAAPNVNIVPGTPGLAGTVLWVADKTPADIAQQQETAPADRKLSIEPPKGGNILRIAEFPPDHLYSQEELDKFRKGIGSPEAFDTKARHFFFHKTHTLDYAIVLEGEIWAMLDEGETLMQPGDVLIQRGTNHAWSNRSARICRVAFVLIDAEHE